MDLADTYITFVRQNQDILRDRVNDELHIEKVFDVSARTCSLPVVVEHNRERGTDSYQSLQTFFNV